MRLEELMEKSLTRHVKCSKLSLKVVRHHYKVLRRGNNVYICLLERSLWLHVEKGMEGGD